MAIPLLGVRDGAAPELDADVLKRVFGEFPTGLTVVTGIDDDGPVGFTCQAFHSVSLDPPLVSLSVMKTSSSYPKLRESRLFAVNVLGAHQSELASQFARKTGDRWADVAWAPSGSGSPILHGSPVAFDCEFWDEFDVGDHTMVIGLIRDVISSDGATDPLVYFRSRFHGLAPDER